jgi:hypothetical protein
MVCGTSRFFLFYFYKVVYEVENDAKKWLGKEESSHKNTYLSNPDNKGLANGLYEFKLCLMTYKQSGEQLCALNFFGGRFFLAL